MNINAQILLRLSLHEHRIHQLKKKTSTLSPALQALKRESEKLNALFNDLKYQNQTIQLDVERSYVLIEIEQVRLKEQNVLMRQAKDQVKYISAKKQIDLCNKIIRLTERNIEAYKEEQERRSIESAEIKGKKDILDAQLFKEISQHELLNKDLISELKKMEGETASLGAEVASSEMRLYRALFERGLSPAVVAVNKNKCSGCSLTFPLQVFQQIRGDNAEKCPHCGRILVQEIIENHQE